MLISASLQACGVVFPFAMLTSICRSIVTICSGLYLLIGMTRFSSKWILSHSTWYKFRRSRQAEPLLDLKTLAQYTDWMKGMLSVLPDARYEVKSFATDSSRNNVAAYGIFYGTHTGQGGPVPPTGRAISTDYVYVMQFDGDRIAHMTKIWNAGM